MKKERSKEVQATMQSLIDIIIKRRKELNLSQYDLADMTGLAQPAIARFETLKVMPTIKTFKKVIDALGLTLDAVPKRQ